MGSLGNLADLHELAVLRELADSLSEKPLDRNVASVDLRQLAKRLRKDAAPS